ncbi:MAG: hypothetical protein HOM80_11985, partial [Bacteroidetes bacterium]|nr:hypothetical protein [Bacteroidota bacterium]
FLFIIFTCSFFTGKTQYYVSISGNDNNQGTISSPFKSIQKAADVIKAGDTCYIRKGIYREVVTIRKNGTSESPIIFTSYQNENVIISGCVMASDWELHQNNIYKTYIPNEVLQLMVNDEIAFEARFPNKNQENRFILDDWLHVTADSNGSVFFEDATFPRNHWIRAYCIILTGEKWVTQIGQVSTSDSNQLFCKNRSHQWNAKGQKNYLGDGQTYIIKHINALDHENEWHWQHDTLYYYTTKNIDELNIEARIREFGLVADHQSHIQLINLRFENANISLNMATNCSIESCSILYPVPFFTFSRSFDRGMQNSDYSIEHWDGAGIQISGRNNKISDSYIGHSWGDGISLGGHNNQVQNCIIEDCNWMATNAAPIALVGENHKILHNTIRNTARSGIVHNDAKKVQIMYNDISLFGLLTQDLGGTYVFKTDGEGSEIAYNWIHDAQTQKACEGVYIDNYCSNYRIHHNVIWHVETGIRTNKPASNLSIYHNTIWLSRYIQKTTGGIQFSNNTNQHVFNNLSSHPMSEGTLKQNNLSISRPAFTNIHVFDFSLKSGSEAIDYGIIVKGLTDKFEGLAPDAGAYEFGLKSWKAGSSLDYSKN